MPRKSRRKQAVHTEKLYCRKCRIMKPAASGFYSAVDPILDTNGKMSVCRDCCNEIYDTNYLASQNLHKALLMTCRILNVAYIDAVADGVEKRILAKQSKGQRVSNIFGIYRQTLTGSINVGADYQTLTFSEPTAPLASEIERPEFEDEEEEKTFDDYVYEWGVGWELDDYIWLENKFREWSSVHKCDTPAEKTLLKEIVWMEYYIKEKRAKGESTSTLVKELQSLMKTAAVDPAKASMENAGKSHETFSDFIKMIEEKEPAEVFGDERDAFVDWQNIKWYFENYIRRPLKNFVTGSKDFNIDTIEEDDEEDTDIQEYLDRYAEDD